MLETIYGSNNYEFTLPSSLFEEAHIYFDLL